MNFNIKDMVYALFGNYANSANVKLTSQKEFLNNTANGISYVSKNKSASVLKTKQVLNELGDKQLRVFKATFGARSEIFDAIDIVKYLDISQQIIETIVNDAFYSFDATEPFTVEYVGKSYDAEEINKRIQRFLKRTKFYQLFRDIADDFVTYGEYYLETPCKVGLGVAELNDTAFVHNIISVYDNYELLYHIAERKTATGTEVVQVDKDALSHFVMDTKRVRVRAGKFDNVVGVPETIKVGRSVFMPVLKLLQRYNLLDIASVAHDLKTALMPPMVKLSVTDQMTPEQMMEAVKRYEEYFMEMGDALHSIDASKEISATQILQLATQIKIVPSSDKSGGLEKASFDSEVNLNESQDRLSERIKSTIGIPSDSDSKSRLDNLREKARYAKKLLDIQEGAARSIASLILKDLRFQNIIIDEDNLEIKFKALQNPNIEEDAEGMFHLATSARDVIRTYIEMAEDIQGLKLNPVMAKKFLDNFMSRFPYCSEMLEVDMFDEDPENPDFDSEIDSDVDTSDSEFIDRESDDEFFDDNMDSGPETIGSEPEEPLVEPDIEEPDVEEPDMEEPQGEE